MLKIQFNQDVIRATSYMEATQSVGAEIRLIKAAEELEVYNSIDTSDAKLSKLLTDMGPVPTLTKESLLRWSLWMAAIKNRATLATNGPEKHCYVLPSFGGKFDTHL